MERLGRYEILEELGRGAMGQVFRGRDPQINRIVAIKTINVAALDPVIVDEFRQRFFREAQAAGQLSHPGIVTIYDVGEDPASGIPYIVMEHIEGKTLDAMGRGQRMAREQGLELIRQVAEALDYAHTQQIVHRDVKPANILVTADARAKITDFGIAKVKTAQFTTTGQVLGTPQYMAPEQLTGQSVDGRADLFALGMILYWLLTGEKAFAGESMATLTFKIVYSEPLAPTKLNPGLGADTDYVINRALAKDPNRRYQRGREFADDVDDLQGGRPPRSRAVLRTPSPPAVGAARHLGPLAPSPVSKTEPLRTSPLAELSVVDRLWARMRTPDFLRLAAPSALVLLLVLALVAWWLVGRTERPSEAEQGASEAPTGITSATLRVRGDNPFDDATLLAYAGDKLIRRARLRKKGKDEQFALNIPVEPGRHRIRIRIEEEGKGFEQSSAIEGDFSAGQTRTLEVNFQRQVMLLGRRRFVLRWLD
ncbi:MAG: serine/threonine-protein kinase [Candidatus Acidiferrales bacterium]